MTIVTNCKTNLIRRYSFAIAASIFLSIPVISSPAQEINSNAVDAERAIQSLLIAPTSMGYNPGPLTTLPTGKRLYIVYARIESSVRMAEEAARAAEILGMDVELISAGVDVETRNSAFDRVVNENPDAVLVIAIETGFWLRQFNEVKSSGIPITILATQETDPAVNNFWGFDASKRGGQIMGDFVAAHSQADARALVVYPEALAYQKGAVEGFQQQLMMRCPDCRVDVIPIATSDLTSGRLTGKIISYIQSKPDTNYLFATIAVYLSGVPEALEAAGIEGVSLVSQGGSTAAFGSIMNGNQLADLAYPIIQAQWVAVDGIARQLAGQPTDEARTWPMIHQILTKDNIDFEVSSHSWPGYTAHEEFFRNIWGVNE